MDRVKIGAVILVLLFWAGCASQGINLTYSIPEDRPLKFKSMSLQVNDTRTVKEILSPSVKDMKIWAGVGGLVNLIAGGSPETFKDSDVREAFEEAFRMRCDSVGLRVSSIQEPGQPALTIEVERLWLDLVGSTFKAEATYLAKFAKDGKVFHQERITGQAEKYNLLGAKTAEDTLSDAFSSAVNGLRLDTLEQ